MIKKIIPVPITLDEVIKEAQELDVKYSKLRTKKIEPISDEIIMQVFLECEQKYEQYINSVQYEEDKKEQMDFEKWIREAKKPKYKNPNKF